MSVSSGLGGYGKQQPPWFGNEANGKVPKTALSVCLRPSTERFNLHKSLVMVVTISCPICKS